MKRHCGWSHPFGPSYAHVKDTSLALGYLEKPAEADKIDLFEIASALDLNSCGMSRSLEYWCERVKSNDDRSAKSHQPLKSSHRLSGLPPGFR